MVTGTLAIEWSTEPIEEKLSCCNPNDAMPDAGEFLDNQRELGGEESNSNNVTDNENNVTSADAVIVRKFTSSGKTCESPYKTRSFE
ncbi:hypothetical protein NPIL_164861 [Nephila pilipes]|uniref:Uncharacterized protein n=1 Tax=Nephila pilipes TaxID=299642 RepID=A0A8X6Q8P7_NEPPI|nr:hypothetical protein NPIL_164861 [Nephila pilipes]